jgi:maleate isomerase
MAPGRVRVEVSRIRKVLDEAASKLPPGVDVLALASTGSGYALGHDEESALVKRLHERWELPVCAASRSAVSALRSRHVERISLVHPPWFGRSLNQLGAEYFRRQGFDVVDARLADLPDDPARIEPAMVVEWVAQHLCHRAEAVFIGGNGFRAARAVHQLERMTGRLVLQANQVLLWSVLESAGAPVAVRGFGMLFDDLET